MSLPPELQAALDRVIASVPPADLARATRALSARYRTPEEDTGFVRSWLDAVAYAAYRLPATYTAARAVLEAVAERLHDWQPETLVDLGAGPGTASWAALEMWPSLRQLHLVERDEHMTALGIELARAAGHPALRDARRSTLDLADDSLELGADLSLVAYALGELAAPRRAAVLDRLWAGTSGVLVLIEPGTPSGFEVIRAARAHLIALGAGIAAPCPHTRECPMAHGDWCHFSRRLPRSRAHRLVKDVALGYEDEKFSYVAATRLPVAPAEARILRHPQVRPGHIRLELCARDRLKEVVVSKRERERFRLARHARWGDEFPDPAGGEGAPDAARPAEIP